MCDQMGIIELEIAGFTVLTGGVLIDFSDLIQSSTDDLAVDRISIQGAILNGFGQMFDFYFPASR